MTPEQRREALRSYDPEVSYRWYKRIWAPFALVLGGVLGAEAVTGLAQDPAKIPAAVVLTGVALFFADFVSALMHKFIDSYASETNPLWGGQARDFRHHHEYPLLGTILTYWQRLTEPAMVASPLIATAVTAATMGWISPEVTTGLFFFLMASVHGPNFHIQSHREDTGRIWGALQAARLVLPRRTHALHHAPPFNTNYGVVNGWSNPVLPTRLWVALDRLYWKYVKRMPNHWVQDPRAIPRDIVEELKRDLAKIPPELWGYSQTAYPQRVPGALKPLLVSVGAEWRKAFVEGRRKIYRELAERGDRAELERQWLEEQRTLEWAYGQADPRPLFSAP